jgi:hypothetical protein
MKNQNIILASILIAIIAGCASAGKSFRYENRNQLKIGSTTTSEAKAKIGNPTKIENASNKNGEFKVYTYSYAFATSYVATVRVLFLEFRNDTLNGKVYNSCFSKEDNTDFKADEIKTIKAGISTKADLVNLIGEPSGFAHFPTTLKDFESLKCENVSYYLSWIYTKKMENGNVSTMKSKYIIAAFDQSDRVCDIRSSSEN